MRIFVLALLIVLTGATLTSYGDNCARVRTVYPTYTPTYNNYTPTYNNTITLVPKVIAVETHRDHYYSIDSFYQQNLLADAIVGRLMQLQTKGTNEEVTRRNVAANILPRVGAAGNIANGSNPVPGQVTQVSRYQSPELSTALKNACLKCHDGSTKPALLSSDDKLLDLPKSYVLNVYHQVNTGRMPKSASPLDDKFLPMIDEWVNASK